jgi:hypothetical protein
VTFIVHSADFKAADPLSRMTTPPFDTIAAQSNSEIPCKEFTMKNVSKRLALCSIFVILLSAMPALAADVTGRWTMDDKDPDGNEVTVALNLKQDGTKLTGTVSVPDETANISEGKVEGNKVSFKATMSDATYTLDGTVDGDEIKMTLKSDDPEYPVHEVTIKRSK